MKKKGGITSMKIIDLLNEDFEYPHSTGDYQNRK